MSTALPWRLLQIALVAAAAWLAWPQEQTASRPFIAPGVVHLDFEEGIGPATSLLTGDGRIVARTELLLRFRWIAEPSSLHATDARGALELRLGESGGGRLAVDDESISLGTTGAGGGAAGGAAGPRSGASWPRNGAAHVGLVWTGERYRALLDGMPLLPELAGPPPEGAALVAFSPDASVRRINCQDAIGNKAEAQGEGGTGGMEQVWWASIATLFGLTCLRARKLAVPLAALSLAVTGASLLGTLQANNVSRLLEPPVRCDQTPIRYAGPLLLKRGAPISLGSRRDGDIRLRAIVKLGERSVIDLLLRTSLDGADRQVMVTLSTDPDMPGGIASNLGMKRLFTRAPGGLSLLEPGRRYALEVVAQDEHVVASLNDEPFGSLSDYDLREGITAIHAIAGEAELTDLRLEPLGQPRALPGVLQRWLLTVGAVFIAAAWACARWSGLGVAGLLWLWPLAVVAPPVAPESLRWPAWFLAALLLLLTPRRGRRVATWLTGAVVLGLALWVAEQRAHPVTPSDLNHLTVAQISGAALPTHYVWARHPLCRRFNFFVHKQTLRGERVTWEKPVGVTRIIGLGSSSTMGHGLSPDQAWPKQLQRLLRERGRSAVEVINAGVSAATAEVLRHDLLGVLLDLRPDVVVVSLGFNDHLLGGTVDERAHFAAMTTSGISWLDGILGRARESFAQRGWRTYRRARSAGQEVDAADEQRYELAPAGRFGDSLRDMVSACRAAGAKALFVAEPIRPGERRPVLAAYHRAMASVGAELGVPVVAPQAALDAIGPATFMDVVHPTVQGQAVLALVIADALEQGILGPR